MRTTDLLGLLPSEDNPQHYDLVVPLSLEELNQPGPVIGEHVVHTYITYPHIGQFNVIGAEP